MTFARSREARFEQVIRRERQEASGELALAADEDLANRGFKIVVDESMRHAAEMRERAHVPVEEARLILTRIEPREVAARVHHPHHEHVRLAALASDVDDHLEEVDLGEVTGLVHERDEHLLALPLPLANDVLHDGVADVVALAAEHRVEPSRGELLLAGGPPLRVLEQLDRAAFDRVANRRTRNAAWLAHTGRCASQVATHRVSVDSHLARDLADGDAVLMSTAHHIDLFHNEHPPSERPASDGGSGG